VRSADRIPPGLDNTVPNVARVYDYFLGGKDNFEVDRQVAEWSLKVMPDCHEGCRNNRAFLRRAVAFMARAGVRQFLDLGSGLPTQGNVHEIAQAVEPSARVVYVDNDAVVHAHASALLGCCGTRVVTADIRYPEKILEEPVVRELIDFDRPVGLLMFAILHHINDDEDPEGVTAAFRDAMPPGSHLAVSHFCNPGDARPEDAARAAESEDLFNRSFGTGRWRRPEEIRAYFGDWDLLDPGLVPLKEWRPDPGGDLTRDMTYYLLVGGVAAKR
jgi:hypothetical protein